MWVKFVKGAETHLPWEFWYSSSKKDSQENCTLVKWGGKKDSSGVLLLLLLLFLFCCKTFNPYPCFHTNMVAYLGTIKATMAVV